MNNSCFGSILDLLIIIIISYIFTSFVYSASTAFSIGFKVLNGHFSPAMKAKIRVYDSNQQKWKAAILEEVSPDQLPPRYGGTRLD